MLDPAWIGTQVEALSWNWRSPSTTLEYRLKEFYGVVSNAATACCSAGDVVNYKFIHLFSSVDVHPTFTPGQKREKPRRITEPITCRIAITLRMPRWLRLSVAADVHCRLRDYNGRTMRKGRITYRMNWRRITVEHEQKTFATKFMDDCPICVTLIVLIGRLVCHFRRNRWRRLTEVLFSNSTMDI